MPTGERRFYLSLLIKNKKEEEERIAQIPKKISKGKKSTTIGGDALKSKLKSGDLPV